MTDSPGQAAMRSALQDAWEAHQAIELTLYQVESAIDDKDEVRFKDRVEQALLSFTKLGGHLRRLRGQR